MIGFVVVPVWVKSWSRHFIQNTTKRAQEKEKKKEKEKRKKEKKTGYYKATACVTMANSV